MKKILTLLAFIVCAGMAQAYDGLDRPFDPKSLSAAEKRILQGLLAREGTYTARLDGAWGRGSQRALLRAVPGRGDPTWRNVAELTRGGIERLVNEKWQVALHRDSQVTYLVPTGITPRARTDQGIAFEAPDGTMRIRSLSISAPEALLLHERLRRRGDRGGADYSINRDAVFVTSVNTREGSKIYARSELSRGSFGTVIVEWDQRRNNQAQLVISSIRAGPQEGLALPNGVLRAAVRDLRQPARPAPQTDTGISIPGIPGLTLDWPGESEPEPATPAPSVPSRATGVAFYINNTDMVASARAVGRCRGGLMQLSDGTVVSKVADLERDDLSVLTSQRRSKTWVRIGSEGLRREVPGLYGIVMQQEGWQQNRVERQRADLLGGLDIGDGRIRYVTTINANRRAAGAPLFDNAGALTGVVLGRVSIDGLTRQQQRQMRDYSMATSASGLAESLRKQGILVDTSRPPSGRGNQNAPAMVALYCAQ